VNLDPLDILNGSFSVIVVATAFIVGFKLIFKYFQYKEKVFLSVGFVAICTSEPYWPHVISYFSTLITGQGLSAQIYFLIGNLFIPFAILFWLWALTDLIYKNKKKLVLFIGILYTFIFEICFFLLLLINPNMIGQRLGEIDVQYEFIMISILVSALGIILITGLSLARESLKSDNPEVKMRGRLLILGFTMFVIGVSLDVLIISNYFNLTISRIIIIIAAFGFYGGFAYVYESIESVKIILIRISLLLIGSILFVVCSILVYSNPGIILYGVIIISWLFTLAFRKGAFKSKTSSTQENSLNEKISKPLIEKLLGFTKPAEITEEEVTYFREQQICIVCKGTIKGFNNFICNCKAIYCKKCA